MNRALHFAVILLAALVAGCATRVDVVADDAQLLSTYRTWDWAPRSHPWTDGRDPDSVPRDADLALRIEERLRENGFERTDGRPEFLVSYRLATRRQDVVVSQPRAIYQLDTHHAQGSFVIEGTDRVTRVYTEIRLAVAATGAQGQTLWRAELVQQAESGFGLALREAVTAVLEHFPQRRGAGAEPLPQRPPCDGAAAEADPPDVPTGPADAAGGEPLAPPATQCPRPRIDREPPAPRVVPTRPQLPA